MPDLTSISAVLSSIKSAIDITKLLKETDLSLENAETKLKLAELIGALGDAKISISDIQGLLIEKDNYIRSLEQKLEVRDKLSYTQPYYWLMADSGKDGPYCQHCYDKDSKLVRLQQEEKGYWCCKVCRNIFTDDDYTDSYADKHDMSSFV